MVRPKLTSVEKSAKGKGIIPAGANFAKLFKLVDTMEGVLHGKDKRAKMNAVEALVKYVGIPLDDSPGALEVVVKMLEQQNKDKRTERDGTISSSTPSASASSASASSASAESASSASASAEPKKLEPPPVHELKSDEDAVASMAHATIFGPEADVWKLNDDVENHIAVLVAGSAVLQHRMACPTFEANDVDVFVTPSKFEDVVEFVQRKVGLLATRPTDRTAKCGKYHIVRCLNAKGGSPWYMSQCFDLEVLHGSYYVSSAGEVTYDTRDRLISAGLMCSAGSVVLDTPAQHARVAKYAQRKFAPPTFVSLDELDKNRHGWFYDERYGGWFRRIMNIRENHT